MGAISFLSPLILHKAWLFFPDNEGLVSGLIYAGYSLGALLGTALTAAWANPDGMHTIAFDISDPSSKPFDLTIAANTPVMIRKLCMAMVLVVAIALALYRHPKQLNQE